MDAKREHPKQVSLNTNRYVVRNIVLWLQLLLRNDGRHVECLFWRTSSMYFHNFSHKLFIFLSLKTPSVSDFLLELLIYWSQWNLMSWKAGLIQFSNIYLCYSVNYSFFKWILIFWSPCIYTCIHACIYIYIRT